MSLLVSSPSISFYVCFTDVCYVKWFCSIWHVSIYTSSFFFLCSKVSSLNSENQRPLDGTYELTRQDSMPRGDSEGRERPEVLTIQLQQKGNSFFLGMQNKFSCLARPIKGLIIATFDVEQNGKGRHFILLNRSSLQWILLPILQVPPL